MIKGLNSFRELGSIAFFPLLEHLVVLFEKQKLEPLASGSWMEKVSFEVALDTLQSQSSSCLLSATEVDMPGRLQHLLPC